MILWSGFGSISSIVSVVIALVVASVVNLIEAHSGVNLMQRVVMNPKMEVRPMRSRMRHNWCCMIWKKQRKRVKMREREQGDRKPREEEKVKRMM